VKRPLEAGVQAGAQFTLAVSLGGTCVHLSLLILRFSWRFFLHLLQVAVATAVPQVAPQAVRAVALLPPCLQATSGRG
jgi:hypothetical protein